MSNANGADALEASGEERIRLIGTLWDSVCELREAYYRNGPIWTKCEGDEQ